jgi:hypothetical protein
MWRRIVRSVLWAKALQHSGSGNLARSLYYLDRMKRAGGLKHFEKVLEASLLLRMHEFDGAEAAFRGVIEETQLENSPNKRYSYLYSFSRLKDIQGDEEAREQARAQARHVPCDETLKKWFPI